MTTCSFFYDQEIQLTYSAAPLTVDEINAAIPKSFEGKDFFVKFYLHNNGGLFEKPAFIYRDKFYEVPLREFNSMDIESFYYIPKIKEQNENKYLFSLIKKWEEKRDIPKKVKEYFQRHFPDTLEAGKNYQQEVSIFAETHFPFACNAAGYDYWIDINTGEIKYIENIDFSMHEISIAPSFYDFCINLQSNRRI